MARGKACPIRGPFTVGRNVTLVLRDHRADLNEGDGIGAGPRAAVSPVCQGAPRSRPPCPGNRLFRNDRFFLDHVIPREQAWARRSRTGDSVACSRNPWRALARNFVRVEQPVASPPRGEEPGSRARDWGNTPRGGAVRLHPASPLRTPAVEPLRRRCWIQTHSLLQASSMPPRVQQHVPQRGSHFPRRSQDVQVVPIRKHLP